jgi:3-demethoxyubiquinol 3-hydroxylase
MSEAEHQTFDCVISGAGMVGASCALALSQLGLTVALIDKVAPEPFATSQKMDLRVSAISLASEQLLQQLGAWPQINAWRSCAYQRLGVWELDSAYLEFDAQAIAQPHLGHIVENRLIQLALWHQIAEQANISLFCPDNIRFLSQHSAQVHISLSSAKRLRCKLLIAADGAHSAIRAMANIGVTGWHYQQSAMVINVVTELGQQDITWQKFLPTGPVAMLPLSGQRASLVWYHQQQEINRLSRLSPAQLARQISEHFPKRLGAIEVIEQASFPLTRQHANNYVQGQILLLGDAAHSINPLAGQGVNLGFKDVKTLQTLMAEAIARGEPYEQAAVLNKYQQIRRTENALMMTGMDALYQGFSHRSMLAKLIRNAGLIAVNQLPMLKQQLLAYACGLR